MEYFAGTGEGVVVGCGKKERVLGVFDRRCFALFYTIMNSPTAILLSNQLQLPSYPTSPPPNQTSYPSIHPPTPT
jgi:hypothetical protein